MSTGIFTQELMEQPVRRAFHGKAIWITLERNLGLGLFVAGVFAGVCRLFYQDGVRLGHGFEMMAIAKSLAETGVFGNPFAPAITGPTAAVPPLFPLFLAALIKIFRIPSVIAFVVVLANILANALIAALMPRLSKVFYADAWPGALGGVLWILAGRLMPAWDASYTLAGLMLFCLLTGTANRWNKPGLFGSVTAGIGAGLLSLMNPATVLVTVPWVALLAWLRRLTFRQRAKHVAIVALMSALCNVPWLARNYRIWHALVLRTNFGMTLYSSNNACAESSLYKNMRKGCYQTTHPVDSGSEIRFLEAVGEVRYDHQRTADALHWIHENPGRFRPLTLSRIAEFWFPDPECHTIWAITILSLPGIILMAMRRQPFTLYLLAVWLLYPIMYYVVVSCDRYRYPVLWTSLLPAGYFLTWLLRQRTAGSLEAL